MLMHISKLTGSVFSSTFLFSRKRNFCLEKQDSFRMTFLKLIISLVLKDASHHFQDFVSRQMTFWFLHLFFILFTGGFMGSDLMVILYRIIYRKHKFYFFVCC